MKFLLISLLVVMQSLAFSKEANAIQASTLIGVRVSGTTATMYYKNSSGGCTRKSATAQKGVKSWGQTC